MLAWGLWIAALFDAVENFSLITILFGTATSPYPEIAQACAGIKFSLILLGLVYCLLAAILRLVVLARPRRTSPAG